MIDLNFFEPYIEKREFKINKMSLLYMVLVLSIVGVTAIAIYNQVQIAMFERQVEDRRLVAENPQRVEKYNEIKELEEDIVLFRDEVNNIIMMDKNIVKNDLISEDLIFEIKSKMPEDLFLTNFSANGRDILISGVARDSYSIAEFSKGLGLIEEIESVFISSIDNREDDFNFVLNTTFKDVNIDEQESHE